MYQFSIVTTSEVPPNPSPPTVNVKAVQPPETAVAQVEKSTEMRIVTITAVVALIVAIVGGGFGVYTAGQQSERSAKQSQQDFLREQRQVAYPALVASLTSIFDDISAVTLAAVTGSTLNVPDGTYTTDDTRYEAAKAVFDADMQQAYLNLYAARLVATDDTFELVDRMEVQFRGVGIDVNNIRPSFRSIGGVGSYEKSLDDVDSSTDELIRISREFFDAARRDQQG